MYKERYFVESSDCIHTPLTQIKTKNNECNFLSL